MEAADSLTGDFDIIDFLQWLATGCVELLDVSTAGILLAAPHGELRLVAASDEETRLLELFALQSDQGPSLQCYRSGTTATNIDLTHPAGTTEWARFAARARTAGFATTYAIPLRLCHRAVGALNLFHTEISRLSDEDVALAQALADISTIAILRQRTR